MQSQLSRATDAKAPAAARLNSATTEKCNSTSLIPTRRASNSWRSGGFELHEFDARLVGIKEVELHFSVVAELSLAAAGAFASVARESCDCIAHLLLAERQVV